jgi:SAM-dependent methyltransferase/uncharacterized protein YbaR (Trm112 family)
MRRKLLELIQCPNCRGEKFTILDAFENDVEIRQGHIQCSECQTIFEIKNGILDLLVEPTHTILSERNGWSILEKMVVNTDELMLSLPDGIGEHKKDWAGQAKNFHYMWSQFKLKGDELVLDLGAGRCWSTRYFAREGCYTIGIDILMTKYVGLLTSDIYLEQAGTYFERICGDMNNPPIRDETFDVIFVAATLHHSSNVSVTIDQIYRMLKPGGRVIVINEPVGGFVKDRNADCEEKRQGINEHIYSLWEYLKAFRTKGWSYTLYPYIGLYHPIISGMHNLLTKIFPGRHFDHGIWVPLVYTQMTIWDGALNLIAYKSSK